MIIFAVIRPLRTHTEFKDFYLTYGDAWDRCSWLNDQLSARMIRYTVIEITAK